MKAAVVLNIISFVAVMGPALGYVGEGGSGSLGILAMAPCIDRCIGVSFEHTACWILVFGHNSFASSNCFHAVPQPKNSNVGHSGALDYIACFGNRTVFHSKHDSAWNFSVRI